MRFLHKPPDQRAAIDSLCESAQGKLLLYQVIAPVPQLLAWLEVWNEFFRDQNLFARTWVAAHAGRAAVDREAAKATNFDSVAPRQGIGHGVQDGLDGKLGVALGELSKALGQASHEIGSSHEEGLKSEAVMNPPDVL